MKQLKRKLCSNAGASMILALLFLMFCMFIGGSVLAAATVNAGRVNQRTSKQQEELNQRSAAMTMAEMLVKAPLELIIEEDCVQKTDASGNKIEVRDFEFRLQADTLKPAMQRTIYEHVINVFLEKNQIELAPSDLFENFTFDDMLGEGQQYTFVKHTVPGDGCYSLTLSDPYDSQKLLHGTLIIEDNGDITLHIEDSEASESKVRVSVKMKCSKNTQITPINNGNTTSITTTTIYHWNSPVIEKEARAIENDP